MKQSVQQVEPVGMTAGGISMKQNESTTPTGLMKGLSETPIFSASGYGPHPCLRSSQVEQSLEYRFIRGVVFVLLFAAGIVAFLVSAVAGPFGIKCQLASPFDKARTHTRICMPYLFQR